jgi:hypothetical protein
MTTVPQRKSSMAGIDRLNVGYLDTTRGSHAEQEKMPFSEHYDVEYEHVEAMRSAFHRVCDALLLRCDVDDPLTEIIVNKIVALAKAGDHDAERLAQKVLDDLADEAA